MTFTPAIENEALSWTPVVEVRPQTLGRAIRSEWIKTRSLRSTWVGMAAAILLLATFAAIAAAVSTGSVTGPGEGGPGFGEDGNPLSTVMTGATFAVLLLGVLGSLAGAREYTSRMITATAAAVPRRWQIVVSKAVVLASVVLLVGFIGVFAAFGIGMAVLAAGDGATASLSDPQVLRSVIGMVGYFTAITLIGFALGIILRSVAGSIGALVAGVLVLPNIAAGLLPDSWGDLLQYLPSSAAASFTAVSSSTEKVLSAPVGALVLVGWVAVALGGAVTAIAKRDV